MESMLNNSVDLNVSSSSSLSMSNDGATGFVAQLGTYDGVNNMSGSNENHMMSNGNLGDDNCMNGATQMTAMSSNGSNGRENRFFSDYVVDILNRWFMENHDYPYPDEYTTELLAKEAKISAKQVRKWFANKRVRSNKCAKQMNKRTRTNIRKTNKSVKCESSQSPAYSSMYTSSPININTNNSSSSNNNSDRLGSSFSHMIGSNSSVESNAEYYESTSQNEMTNAHHSIHNYYQQQHHHHHQQQQQQQHYFNNYYNAKSEERADELTDSTTTPTTTNRLAPNTHTSLSGSQANVSSNLVSVAAAASVLLNPYLLYGLQNLIQNSQLSMAMANRISHLRENFNLLNQANLINNNNNMNNGINIGQPSSVKSEPTAVNSFKRKTHLSNCFLNDLSRDAKQAQTVNHPDDVCKPATSTYKFSERLLQLSLSTSLSSSLSSSSSSSPVHDSSYSPQFSPTEQQPQHQQQQQPDLKLNQHVFLPRRKINFGDVYDLIN